MATEPAGDAAEPLQRFLALLAAAADDADDALGRLILSRYRGSEPDLQRIEVRPIAVRGQPHWSFVYRHARRDVTKNLPPADALAMLRPLIESQFGHALLHTRSSDVQLETKASGKRFLHVRAVPQRDLPSPQHDRVKPRHADPGAAYLRELGILGADGKPVPAMARKWKQIDKFVQILDHAFETAGLAAAQRDSVQLVDYGAGKGYLTFAAEHWLRQTRGLKPQVTGVELRPELVAWCNDAAARLHITDSLRFVQGDIASHAPGPADIVIALHACDTATDDAMHAGIRAGASIIVCAPCCHKQLRPQLKSPPELQPLLRHGIHLGQQAEMLTDGLRALLLETQGYEAQVFEFVSLEHTSKNKMILAVRHGRPVAKDALRAQIAALMQTYGIGEQRLDALLT